MYCLHVHRWNTKREWSHWRSSTHCSEVAVEPLQIESITSGSKYKSDSTVFSCHTALCWHTTASLHMFLVGEQNPLFVCHECIWFIFLVLFTLYLVFSIAEVARVISLNWNNRTERQGDKVTCSESISTLIAFKKGTWNVRVLFLHKRSVIVTS